MYLLFDSEKFSLKSESAQEWGVAKSSSYLGAIVVACSVFLGEAFVCTTGSCILGSTPRKEYARGLYHYNRLRPFHWVWKQGALEPVCFVCEL